MGPEWEAFAEHVERIAVPGGHLYRTCSWIELPSGSDEPNRGYWHWSDPEFVPAVTTIGFADVPDGDLTDDEQAMLATGRTIGCVKAVRERLQIPLKDAKAIVDRHRGSRP